MDVFLLISIFIWIVIGVGALVSNHDAWVGKCPMGSCSGGSTRMWKNSGACVKEYTLNPENVVNNYEGKPNGKGEEHWSEVTVEVKPLKVQTIFHAYSYLIPFPHTASQRYRTGER